MKRNYIKSLPIALVGLLALAGCDNNSEPNLANFVGNLKVGELTEEEVAPLFENNLLASNNKNIRFAEYSFNEYSPRWQFNDGLEDELYEQYVHNVDETYTFRRYDNDVVVTTEDVTRYDYDKTQYDPNDSFSTGLAKTPVTYNGKSIIYAEKPTEEDEEGNITCIYTRNNKASDPYSFVDKTEYNEDLMDKVLHGGAGGVEAMYDVQASIDNVKDSYDSYASGIQGIYENSLNTKYTKNEDGSLEVVYSAILYMTPWSAEANWAYEEVQGEDGETTKRKTTNAYDGMYVKLGYVFSYYLKIAEGFVADAQFIHFGITAYLLKDNNWKSGDPTPNEDLTEEELSKLDLVPTDTLADGSANYVQGGIMSKNPYTFETLKTDGENLGNYRKTMPKESEYRVSDMSDYGCWFNIQQDLRE